MPWKEVADHFSEKQRHYKDTYLEIDQVYFDEKDSPVCEVSIFSSKKSPYEIYISYGKMYGIVYTDEEHGYDLQEEMMQSLEDEYKKRKSKGPSSDFIKQFCEKYEVCIPMDTFFDWDIEKMAEALDSLYKPF